jgi:hypothetical protein
LRRGGFYPGVRAPEIRGHLTVEWHDESGTVIRGDAGGWRWLGELVASLARQAEDFMAQHYDSVALGGPLAPGSQRLDVVRIQVGDDQAESPFLRVSGIEEDPQITVDDQGLSLLAHMLDPAPADAAGVERLEQELRRVLHRDSAPLRLQWIDQP